MSYWYWPTSGDAPPTFEVRRKVYQGELSPRADLMMLWPFGPDHTVPPGDLTWFYLRTEEVHYSGHPADWGYEYEWSGPHTQPLEREVHPDEQVFVSSATGARPAYAFEPSACLVAAARSGDSELVAWLADGGGADRKTLLEAHSSALNAGRRELAQWLLNKAQGKSTG